MKDYPGYGLIQHMQTKKYLKRYDLKNRAKQQAPEFLSGYDYESLFSVAQDSRTFGHIKGLNFHPIGDAERPKDPCWLLMAPGVNSATKFAGRDSKMDLANVHQATIKSGHWKLLL